MKKIMIAAALLMGLAGLTSAVQATHADWVKSFWEEQGRHGGGSSD